MNEVTQPVRGRGVLGSVTAIVAALVAFLVFAPLASAASDPLASGTTTITLSKGFSNKLAKNGIKLTGTKPGSAKGSAIVLPLASGTIDPATGQGTVTHAGGFKLKRGKKSAAVGELTLDAGAKSLQAKVAGKAMKLASVEGTSVSRDGFGINLAVTSMKLTGSAANALNRKLGFLGKGKAKGKGKGAKGKASAKKALPFKANLTLGTSYSDTEPSTTVVLGTGISQLLVTPAEAEPYKTAEVKPVMIDPGAFGPTIEGIPALNFPITGGAISPSGSAGQVNTTGGVIFGQEPESGVQLGVSFGSFAIDFTGRTVSADVAIDSNDQANFPTPGKLDRRVVADLDMSHAVIQPNPAARTISFSGVRTVIRSDLADLMNSTYKKGQAFKAGDSLGTFIFTIQTQ